MSPGGHQLEPPSHLNKFLESTLSPVDLQIKPFYFVVRLIINCMSFLYFHWFFFLSARKTSQGNVSLSIYKSTREMAEFKD